MKDLEDEMVLMRQQNSWTNGLRMRADRRGNTIQRVV
jgi:hypothetical protein